MRAASIYLESALLKSGLVLVNLAGTSSLCGLLNLG